MKTNELRIGNYVMYADVICKVEGYSGGLLQTDGVYTNISKFNPIRIDEKWLIKFGFDIEDSIATYNGRQHEFNIHTDNGETWKPLDYKGGFKHLYYVHQLQNLYFALTGYELEITNLIEPGFHYCNDFKEPFGALFFCSVCGKKL